MPKAILKEILLPISILDIKINWHCFGLIAVNNIFQILKLKL